MFCACTFLFPETGMYFTYKAAGEKRLGGETAILSGSGPCRGDLFSSVLSISLFNLRLHQMHLYLEYTPGLFKVFYCAIAGAVAYTSVQLHND